MTQNAAASPAPPVNVERWGWYSIGINVTLIGINLLVARASGSLAVGAELTHNAVDLLTAIAVLVGLRLAARKTAQFPYGLYKLENVIAVGLAGMTFFTAYEIAREALSAATSPPIVTLWSLAGVVIAWIIPLVFSVFELRAGRAANSPALIADALEYRAHVFTTGVVFAALVGQWVNVPLDRIAALFIVIAIVKTGWDLLSDGMHVLLDASLDAESLLQVREIIVADPAVTALRWVTGHNAGRFRSSSTASGAVIAPASTRQALAVAWDWSSHTSSCACLAARLTSPVPTATVNPLDNSFILCIIYNIEYKGDKTCDNPAGHSGITARAPTLRLRTQTHYRRAYGRLDEHRLRLHLLRAGQTGRGGLRRASRCGARRRAAFAHSLRDHRGRPR